MLSIINSEGVEIIEGSRSPQNGQTNWLCSWKGLWRRRGVSWVLKPGEDSDGLGQNEGKLEVNVQGMLEL